MQREQRQTILLENRSAKYKGVTIVLLPRLMASCRQLLPPLLSYRRSILPPLVVSNRPLLPPLLTSNRPLLLPLLATNLPLMPPHLPFCRRPLNLLKLETMTTFHAALVKSLFNLAIVAVLSFP